MWAGFQPSIQLDAHPIKPENEREFGNLVSGRRYISDKTRYSYAIKLFAPGSFLKSKREEIFSYIKKLEEIKPKPSLLADVGSYKTSSGNPFHIVTGGIGPGGGSTIAMAFSPQFDIVVEEITSDEGHPLDRTGEQGILPSKRLPEIFETVFTFFAKQTEVSP